MRKRTKRKVWALVNPLQHAMSGAAITPDAQLRQLQQKELGAIDSFARGGASEWEWYDITAMVNVTRIMAEAGVGPEALEACERAEGSLRVDFARFQQTGKMGTTGSGLQAYRDVYEYQHLQRTSISRSEYEKHLRKAISRVKFTRPGTEGSPDPSP